MRSTFLLAAAFAALSSAIQPPSAEVLKIGHAGTGCPSSELLDLDFGGEGPDTAAFAFYTTKFIASVGPGIANTEQRKECTTNTEVKYTPGWQFRLGRVESYGNVSVSSPNINAQVRVSSYFSGQKGQKAFTANYKGRETRKFDLKLKDDDAAQNPWSPCNGDGTLNMETSAALQSTNKADRGRISIDHVRYYIVWQKCPK